MSIHSKRPFGVLVVAVLLGVFAAILLASGALFGVLGFLYHAGSLPASGVPAQPLPPPAILKGVLAALVVLYVTLAAWSIATLVGLVALKRWARYSVLVMGSLLAFFGILSTLGLAVGAAAVPPTLSQSPVPPHTMAIIFLFIGSFYAFLAGLGVWWLIYFNLRSVKAAFQPTPAAYASLAFETFQYAVPAGQPGTLPPSLSSSTAPAGLESRQPPPLVIALACLYLLSAFLLTVFTFLPFPMFLFGFIVHGMAARLAYLLTALLIAAIGVGLLRLDNRARLAVYALSLVGILHFALLPLPYARAAFTAYNQEITTRMGLPATANYINAATFPRIMIFTGVEAVAIYLVIFWILQRHREQFLKPQALPTGS